MKGRRCDRGSPHGYGLVGVLMALLVLGGLAAVVLTAIPGSGTSSLHKRISSLPGLAAQPPHAQISAAAQQACQADYSALEEAVSLYQVEHRALPTTVAQLQPYFRGALSTPEFTLSIDPGRAGQVEVQTNRHPASEGAGNCRFA